MDIESSFSVNEVHQFLSYMQSLLPKDPLKLPLVRSAWKISKIYFHLNVANLMFCHIFHDINIRGISLNTYGSCFCVIQGFSLLINKFSVAVWENRGGMSFSGSQINKAIHECVSETEGNLRKSFTWQMGISSMLLSKFSKIINITLLIITLDNFSISSSCNC